MNIFLRTLQRIFLLVLNGVVLWFIYMHIFDPLDQRFPLLVALVATYILSAYVLLPQLIHLCIMIFRKGRIPRITYSADGLIADPVNIILIGTKEQLCEAFRVAGWYTSDPLTISSALKMMKRFVLNEKYLEAPFSSLYLFGRSQDFGFQQPLGESPRRRNHVRFWAVDIDPLAELTDIRYWTAKSSLDVSKARTWVGSASKDTGFGLTRFSYKISHKVDTDVDKEREYVLNSLENHNLISNVGYVEAGELVVGKYISDGRIAWAKLKGQGKNML